MNYLANYLFVGAGIIAALCVAAVALGAVQHVGVHAADLIVDIVATDLRRRLADDRDHLLYARRRTAGPSRTRR